MSGRSDPKLDGAIGAAREDPWLARVEFATHGTEACGFLWSVRFEDFDWDNQCVLKEVIEHHSIKDVDGAIIRATGEEWVLLTEVNLTNGLVVILQVLVWRAAHVHIEPDDLFIICAENEVVALRVNADARYPLGACLVFVHHALLLEVVLEHGLMCGDHKVWLRWVECHGLNDTLGLREGSLRGGLRY